jgi:hypothetical protein
MLSHMLLFHNIAQKAHRRTKQLRTITNFNPPSFWQQAYRKHAHGSPYPALAVLQCRERLNADKLKVSLPTNWQPALLNRSLSRTAAGQDLASFVFYTAIQTVPAQ